MSTQFLVDSLVFCVVLRRSLFVIFFLLIIVLSVPFRFKAYAYPFGTYLYNNRVFTLKSIFFTLRHRYPYLIWLYCVGPLVYLFRKNFNVHSLPIFWLSVPDEDYSRNASLALNYISWFLLLVLGWYKCISPGRLLVPESNSSCSHCFSTDMV